MEILGGIPTKLMAPAVVMAIQIGCSEKLFISVRGNSNSSIEFHFADKPASKINKLFKIKRLCIIETGAKGEDISVLANIESFHANFIEYGKPINGIGYSFKPLMPGHYYKVVGIIHHQGDPNFITYIRFKIDPTGNINVIEQNE